MNFNHKKIFILSIIFQIIFMGLSVDFYGQTGSITGYIKSDNLPVNNAHVRLEESTIGTNSDDNGRYLIGGLNPGKYSLKISAIGFKTQKKDFVIKTGEQINLNIELLTDTALMNTVEIKSNRLKNDMGRLSDVENLAINAGKKNEVILLENIQGNLSANTARQIFAKVPGMHIQENDGGGIQMAVSARGLNPSRMLEFNVRQNGYDIAADALGYPESYYTPPAFMMQKIEVIRGAASLQYGPQFGGLINFILKKGCAKPIQGEVQATYGSFNFIALNAAIGGSKGKFNYYGFVGKRRGDGWRDNSAFDITNGFVHADWNAHKKVNIGLEYTSMLYTMRQPGGLTDTQFDENAKQSFRNRNWFTASWNIIANTIDYQINKNNKINIRNFLVVANRYSVGNLSAPVEVDSGGFRNLQKDNYLNFGTEIRYLHQYKIVKTENTLLTGVRIYRGNTHRMQGLGSAESDANFVFNNPSKLEDSDFKFPSWNLAVFAEIYFLCNNSIFSNARYSRRIYTNHCKGLLY